jgi:hypothetical protein
MVSPAGDVPGEEQEEQEEQSEAGPRIKLGLVPPGVGAEQELFDHSSELLHVDLNSYESRHRRR